MDDSHRKMGLAGQSPLASLVRRAGWLAARYLYQPRAETLVFIRGISGVRPERFDLLTF